MLNTSFYHGFIFLKNMVQKEPGSIVGPISKIFGFILNMIFNFIYSLTQSEANLLGFSIILLTIVARFALLPLAIKSQKSMSVMQKLQPEMEKIKNKYGDSKDPEDQKRMNVEIQKLYSENKASPFGGCLPLLFQFPIFMALYYIMNQSYRFIDRLGSIYEELALKIMEIPHYYEYVYDIGFPKMPKGMIIDLTELEDFVKLLSKFKAEDWSKLLSEIPAEHVPGIETVLNVKNSIENFFTIGLTENTGLYWPVIIIPILAVLTSFLSSYLSTKQSKSTDPNVQMQQKVMLIMMPVMMGFITVGMPGGVGLYWITSSMFQVVQQIILNKVFSKKDDDDNIGKTTASKA